MKFPKPKFSRKFFVVLIILVVIGGFFIWRRFIATKNDGIETTEIKRGTVKEELILSGEIKADEHVTLQFPASGLLTWVGVKEGDSVKKYQAIASLDARALKKTLEKYLNTYGKTRNTFEQTHDDNRDWELTPDAEEREALSRIVANAQLDLESSVLDVELQDLSIKLATLTTPIAGVVTQVTNPIAGVNIIATQAKFEIVNPKTIYFEVTADQSEVVEINENQEINIVFDSFPDKTFKGQLKNISYAPLENDISTVYKVKVEFASLDVSQIAIRLGMTGDARFILKQKEDVFYVPTKFLNSDEKGKYLNLDKKNNKVYVETGLEGEDTIEIVGEISEGQVVYD